MEELLACVQGLAAGDADASIPGLGETGTLGDLSRALASLHARHLMSEHRLEEERQRLQAVIDHSPAVIYLKDVEKRYLLANRRFETWFGFTPEEALGRTRLELSGQAEPDRWDEQDAFVLAGGEVEGEEVEHLCADGVRRRILVTKFLVRSPEGDVLGLGGIDSDLTSQRDVEARLAHSQRLESLGRLTGGVAHDFNNMLAVVLGNLDLILDALPPESETRALAEEALHATERGAEITRRLLAFSRRQDLRPRMTDVNGLVEGMIAMLRRTLGETITIETELDKSLPRTWIDAGQLESALLNLAINARDATGEGGRLRITTARAPLEGEHARILISVSDDGPGMPPEVVEHAFDPFFTTKSVGEGSGLGLSMVHGFVTQSGGEVRIESSSSRGTNVGLYLPVLGPGPDAGVLHGEASDELPRGRGELVLVVEDDTLLRNLTARIVASLGYRVHATEDAKSALEALGATPDISALFTDVVLPGGMNGVELAAAARERRPELPCLFTSGHLHRAGEEPEADPSPLLRKPYRPEDLARALGGLLADSREPKG